MPQHRRKQLLVLYGTAIGMASGLVTMIQGSNPPKSPTITLPSTYRALVANAAGSSFADVAHIATSPVPTLGPDDALVRVVYAGVNGGCETFRARGEPGTPFAANRDSEEPFPLGAEGVGVVAAVGSNVDVGEFEVGDAVCFVGSAFAEYSVCKAATLWKIPEAKAEYVGLRVSGLTACAMLELTGKLRPGETVLITAAAGGAGHFAVQFAKLAGCTVIGTCGSAYKAETLKALGCDHVINYKTQDVKEEIARLTRDSGGLDAVLEGVGGELLQVALDALAPEGRLLQVGYISEYPHNPRAATETSKNDIDAADLFWNQKTVHRGKQTIYGNAWPNDYAKIAGCKDRVLGLFAEGKLQSLVDKTETFVGLESVSDAINYMLSGNTIGKVVVKIT